MRKADGPNARTISRCLEVLQRCSTYQKGGSFWGGFLVCKVYDFNGSIDLPTKTSIRPAITIHVCPSFMHQLSQGSLSPGHGGLVARSRTRSHRLKLQFFSPDAGYTWRVGSHRVKFCTAMTWEFEKVNMVSEVPKIKHQLWTKNISTKRWKK